MMGCKSFMCISMDLLKVNLLLTLLSQFAFFFRIYTKIFTFLRHLLFKKVFVECFFCNLKGYFLLVSILVFDWKWEIRLKKFEGNLGEDELIRWGYLGFWWIGQGRETEMVWTLEEEVCGWPGRGEAKVGRRSIEERWLGNIWCIFSLLSIWP